MARGGGAAAPGGTADELDAWSLQGAVGDGTLRLGNPISSSSGSPLGVINPAIDIGIDRPVVAPSGEGRRADGSPNAVIYGLKDGEKLASLSPALPRVLSEGTRAEAATGVQQQQPAPLDPRIASLASIVSSQTGEKVVVATTKDAS
jgi:hypothetical protein